MAEKHETTSGERFRQLINRIDEQQEAQAKADAPAPAYPATSDKQVVPVKSKVEPAPTPELTVTEKEEKKGFSVWEAFRNFAIIFSFVVNVILVVVVIGLAAFIFEIRNSIAEPLLGGLYNGFVEMDNAHIETTIPVNTTIQVNDKVTADFSLPLQQTTNVVLAENTLITGASVTINGGILQLSNAPTTIVLPKGTVLPVILDLQVPVKQDIPVTLSIPVSIPVTVDIPLQQTQLHKPFSDLRDLFEPYYLFVNDLPSSWGEAMGVK